MIKNILKNQLYGFAKKSNSGIKPIKHRYDLHTAMQILKSYDVYHHPISYEVVIKLGTKPERSDQNVRGICYLPQGTGKTKKIAFYSSNLELVKIAESEGAFIVTEDMVQ